MRKFLRLSSRSARARRRKDTRAGVRPERLEQRLALDATLGHMRLGPAMTLNMDTSFGPTPVVMSMQQVAGNDVKSFVISHVPEGSVVEKWNSNTGAWIDVSTMPTSADPHMLMQFLANRTLHQGDKLQWRPKASLTGKPQRAFEMLNWDDSSNLVPPNPDAVPSEVQNLYPTWPGPNKVTLTWDPPTTGEVTAYSIVIDSQIYLTKETTFTFTGLTRPLASNIKVFASNAAGAGPATVAAAAPAAAAAASTWDIRGSFLPTDLTGPNGNILIPQDSPWGNRIGFPAVPYESIAANPTNAAIPNLTLPIDLTEKLDSEGVSFSMWVQATSPGMLLSAQGDFSTQGYSFQDIPYIWIDDNGKVNAGLYGPGPLTPLKENYTILTTQSASGEAQIGSPLAITSQVTVVDSTWHHIAFVANTEGQVLYVDGLLQGARAPNYVQNFTNRYTESNNTITIPLTEAPEAGTPFDAVIYQSQTYQSPDVVPSSPILANATYSLSGLVGSSGLTITSTGITGAGNDANGSVLYTKVTNATLTGTTLTITFEDAILPGTTAYPISVSTSYQVTGGAFTFSPALSNTGPLSLAGTSAVIGKTAHPMAITNSVNYPQPFTGSVDEVAFWKGTGLSQSDAQQLMTQPVSLAVNGTTFPSGYTAPGIETPTLYFDFNSANFNKNNDEQYFTSQSPASNTSQNAYSTGLTVTTGTTIPTDPFTETPRLGQYLNYGLGIMTPLASGTIPTPSTAPNNNEQTTSYKVALAAGDSFSITRPASGNGAITVTAIDDLGQYPNLTNDTNGINVAYNVALLPDEQLTLVAPRSGTYQLTLTYAPTATTTPLGYYETPGILNPYQVLTNSYRLTNGQETTIASSYSNPAFPGILKSNQGYDTGPGNYFPEWTDAAWFPQSYSDGELGRAYDRLVAQAELDFANLNGASLSGASTTWDIATWVQAKLTYAYTVCYGTPPAPEREYFPTPTSPGYIAPPTPQEAVYEFLYNTNQARIKLSATLQQIEGTIGLANSTQGSTAADIANTISENQQAFVTGEEIPIANTQPNMGGIAQQAAVSSGILAADNLFGPVAGVAVNFGLEMILGFAQMRQPTNTPTSSINISFVPVMQSLLNFEHLSELADNIDASMSTFLSQITSALQSQNYLTSVFSNYGLLEAFSSTSIDNQENLANDIIQAEATLAAKQAWMTMIPATFHWEQVTPDAFPSANISNGNFSWGLSQASTSGGVDAYQAQYVTTGDFNNDGFPDIVTANNLYKGNSETSISILFGQPGYANGGPTAPVSNGYGYLQSWNYSNSAGSTTVIPGPKNGNSVGGLTNGDYNNDGHLDILVVVSNIYEGQSYFVVGYGDETGTITYSPPYTNFSPNQTYVYSPVTADFNQDGLADFAFTFWDTGSSKVYTEIAINTTNGIPKTSPSLSLTGSLGTVNSPASFGVYSIETNLSIETGVDVSPSQWLISSNSTVFDADSDSMPDLAVPYGAAAVIWDHKLEEYIYTPAPSLNGTNVFQNKGVSNGEWAGFSSPAWISSPDPIQTCTSAVDSVWVPVTGSVAAGDYDGDGQQDDLAVTYLWDEFSGYGTPPDDSPAGLYLLTNALASNPSWSDGTVGIQSQIATVPAVLLDIRSGGSGGNSSNPDGIAYISLTGGIGIVHRPFELSSRNAVPFLITISTDDQDVLVNAEAGQVVVDPSGMIATVYAGSTSENSASYTTLVGWSQNMLTNNPLATFVPDGPATQAQNALPAIFQTMMDAQGGSVVTMPVAANQIVTQLASPGFFLSATPANIVDANNQTISWGHVISGWQLMDGLNNPIAVETLYQLFGAPGVAISSDGTQEPPILPNLWTPGTVEAADPVHPLVAYNNGWFLHSAPIGDAAATWAEAFFQWGDGVEDYSPSQRNLLTSSSTAIPSGTPYTYENDTWLNPNGGTLNQWAAQSSPPAAPTTTAPQSLSADTDGVSGEVTLSWEPPSSSLQNLPVGYRVTAFQGATNPTVVLTEATSFTFSGLDTAQDVYFTVQGITLQGFGETANLLVGPSDFNSPISTAGMAVGVVSDGTAFTGGGFDGAGNAYSWELVNSLSWNGVNFQIGPANQPNVTAAVGQTIKPPSGFTTGSILVAAASSYGAEKGDFILTYGQSVFGQLVPVYMAFTQIFSDWASPLDLTDFPNLNQAHQGQLALPYYDTAGGDKVSQERYIYVYELFVIGPLESITLPNAPNLRILDIQFVP
jgi:hypothetical protein